MRKITYGTHALASSHLAVLKSIILLSERQNGCSWVLVPQAANADVVFLGPDSKERSHSHRPGQIMVSMGNSPEKQFHHLEMPLILPQVSKQLLAITEAVGLEQESEKAGSYGQSQLMPSVWDFGFATAPGGNASPASGKRYQLKKWPPAGIIGENRHYMRAAAALSNAALTSEELAEKTKIPLQDCREFLGKLKETDCLQVASADADSSFLRELSFAKQSSAKQTSYAAEHPKLASSSNAPSASNTPKAPAPSPPPKSATTRTNTPPVAEKNKKDAAPAAGLLSRLRAHLGGGHK